MESVQKQDVVYRLVGVKVVVREGGWCVAGSSWWGMRSLASLWVGIALRAVASVGGTVRMEPVNVSSAVALAGGGEMESSRGPAVGVTLCLAVLSFVHYVLGK